MKKHMELACCEFNEGRNRLCLDRIISSGEFEGQYSIVWRGNKNSRNAFVPRPAYFTFEYLANLINDAVEKGEVSKQDARTFINKISRQVGK